MTTPHTDTFVRAVSANPILIDIGTVLHVGNTDNAIVQDLSLAATTPSPSIKLGSSLTLAVSPSESGNIGGNRALAAGRFSLHEDEEYVAKVIGKRIAQTDQTTLRSGSSDYVGNKDFHFGEGNRAYGVESIARFTGTVTYNTHRGSGFNYWDGEAGAEVDFEILPTDAVPGRLVYRDGSPTPILDTYKGIIES